MTRQYQCPSYYDDDNVLRDCTCGKCNANSPQPSEELQRLILASDGYHTFEELYEHRIALFIALMRAHPELSWWSRLHADGTMWEGWIIAGMHLPTGDITYHMADKYVRDYLDSEITEFGRAPEWDGHTPANVVKRIEWWVKNRGRG